MAGLIGPVLCMGAEKHALCTKGGTEGRFCTDETKFCVGGTSACAFCYIFVTKIVFNPEEPFSFMQTMKKQEYVSPESRVIKLRTEGVIAYSYVNPFEEHEIW